MLFHIWSVVLLFLASLSSHDHVLWALLHEHLTCTVASHSQLRLKPLSFGGLSRDGCWSYVISFLWAYQSLSLFLPSCILNHFPLSIPPSSWALIFIPSCWCLYSSVLFFLSLLSITGSPAWPQNRNCASVRAVFVDISDTSRAGYVKNEAAGALIQIQHSKCGDTGASNYR